MDIKEVERLDSFIWWKNKNKTVSAVFFYIEKPIFLQICHIKNINRRKGGAVHVLAVTITSYREVII